MMQAMQRQQEQEAMTALKIAPYSALRSVICCISEQRVVLSGQVPSFYLKQVAQSLVLDLLCHTLKLENQLQVSQPAETATQQ